MHKVGLELSFALDVDDASAGAHVAQGKEDETRLLRHLQGESDDFSLSYTTELDSCRQRYSALQRNTFPEAAGNIG